MAIKVAFYADQASGLGHLARAVWLTRLLNNERRIQSAIVCGCPVIQQMPVAPEVFHWRLPCLPTRATSPGDAFKQLQERAQSICDFVAHWQPDVFVVDHFPIGVGGELAAVFDRAIREKWTTRFVIGVPYTQGIWASPWKTGQWARRFEVYHHALGYNDASFDPVLADLPMYTKATTRRYFGVVAPRPLPRSPERTSAARKIVVSTGGGEDGHRLYPLILAACAEYLRKGRIQLSLVCGPNSLITNRHVYEQTPGVRMVSALSAVQSTEYADVVISNCGYNSAYTLIQSNLPIIFIPRPTIFGEQETRAKKLANLTGVWNIDERSPERFTLNFRSALSEAVEMGSCERKLPFRVVDEGSCSHAFLTTAN